jgi:hypothetical protein
LEISPPDSGRHTVFAGTESGLFWSINEGKSWREILLPFGNDPILSMALSHNYGADGCLWISSENYGLWFSGDHGNHWELEKDFSGASPLNSVQIFPGPAGEQHVAVMSADWIRYRSLSDQAESPWSEFQPTVIKGNQLMAFSAPFGFGPGKWFWVGFSNGQVMKFSGKS